MSTLEDMENLQEKEYAVGTNFITTDQDIDFLEKGGYYTNLLELWREFSNLKLKNSFRNKLINDFKEKLRQYEGLANSTTTFDNLIDQFTYYINTVLKSRDSDRTVTQSLEDAKNSFFSGSTSNQISVYNIYRNIYKTMIHKFSSSSSMTILQIFEMVLSEIENIHGDVTDILSQTGIIKVIIDQIHINNITSIQSNTLLSHEQQEEKIQIYHEKIEPEIIRIFNEVMEREEDRVEIIRPIRTFLDLLKGSDYSYSTITSFINCTLEILKMVILLATWVGSIPSVTSREISYELHVHFPYLSSPMIGESYVDYVKRHPFLFVDGTSHKPFVTIASMPVSINSDFQKYMDQLVMQTGDQIMDDQAIAGNSLKTEILKYDEGYLHLASLSRVVFPAWDFEFPVMRMNDIPFSHSSDLIGMKLWGFMILMNLYKIPLAFFDSGIITLSVSNSRSIIDAFKELFEYDENAFIDILKSTLIEPMFDIDFVQTNSIIQLVQTTLSISSIFPKYTSLTKNGAKYSSNELNPEIFQFNVITTKDPILKLEIHNYPFFEEYPVPGYDYTSIEDHKEKLENILIEEYRYIYNLQELPLNRKNITYVNDDSSGSEGEGSGDDTPASEELGTLNNPFKLILTGTYPDNNDTNGLNHYDVVSTQRESHPYSQYLSYITIAEPTNDETMGIATVHYSNITGEALENYELDNAIYYYYITDESSTQKKYYNSKDYRLTSE